MWITVGVIAILAGSMFLAGFLLGSRVAIRDPGAEPTTGRFSYEADSGTLPADNPTE